MLSMEWDGDFPALFKLPAHSSATALASKMMEGWSHSFKARELRDWPSRCMPSGLRGKRTLKFTGVERILSMKFSTSNILAKLLSYLLSPQHGNSKVTIRSIPLDCLVYMLLWVWSIYGYFPIDVINFFFFQTNFVSSPIFLFFFPSSSQQQLEIELLGDIPSCTGQFYPLTQCLLWLWLQ